ncbi:MAG: hypothetical protein Q7R33_01640 [Nitrosarchaeum sp.]|nr:hypothetical protein [Nitrosarchaeum sp.]
MNTKLLIGFGIAVLLAGLCIGFPIGQGCKKCAEIKVGTETTLVTVTVHDTIVTEKTASDFTTGKKIVYVPKYIYVDSSKTTDTISVADTAVCYSFEEYERDGAFIKAEICSDSLPVNKPLDLRGTFTYQAPPDTARSIMRIDTIMRSKEVPFYKDWKTYTIAILAVTTGVLIFRK